MHENILIVEDDENLSNNLKDLLEEAGYYVSIANNGEQGISLAKESSPDLILCDIMMPGIDGYKVKETLAKDPLAVSIPFLFLTAKATLDDIRKGMLLGADDYIVKPYRAKELLRSIQIRLERKQQFKHGIINQDADNSKRLTYDDRILIKIKEGSAIVNISDIACITALSEYSQIELNSGELYVVRKLLKQWEDLLPENDFLRIHRSTIININCIKKIEKWFNRAMKISMKCLKKDFIVSQRYTSKIKANLSV